MATNCPGLTWKLMMSSSFGIVNELLTRVGILSSPSDILWLADEKWSLLACCIADIWLTVPFMMLMTLAGLQGLDTSVNEAAKIDGANGWKTFWKITVPLLKPTIIMTFIMSINGTLQLFDESVNLTKGGPANSTITMSHYVYNTCFINVPNFGYAAAMSFIIFIMVAILAFINLKVGDTRD